MEDLFKSIDPKQFKILTQSSVSGRGQRYDQYINAQERVRRFVIKYISK